MIMSIQSDVEILSVQVVEYYAQKLKPLISSVNTIFLKKY